MISPEYIQLLANLLNVGYKSEYYYDYYSFAFEFPTGIMVVAKNNGVEQATALAKVVSIVEEGGELSITFSATFTETFEADEIDLYAVIGSTLLYKIASTTGDFSSSADDNLSVDWTIDIVVSNIFQVGNQLTVVQLPNNNCLALSGQLVIYPYLIHFLIALTLIPSPAFTVQSSYPSIPLATMFATIPVPSSPQQLQGITSFIYLCGNTPLSCYQVYNGLGTAIITQDFNCSSPVVVALYQVGSTYLAYMQSQVQVQLSVGRTYSYQFGVSIT